MDDSEALSEEKEMLLTQCKPEMLRKIRLTPLFWATLSKYDVITGDEIGDIQRMGTAAPQEQVNQLLDHIAMGPSRRYTGLLRALADTGQEHIVTDLLNEQLPLSAHKAPLEAVMGDHSGQYVQTSQPEATDTLPTSLMASSQHEDFQRVTDEVNMGNYAKKDDARSQLPFEPKNGVPTCLSQQKVTLLTKMEPQLLEYIRLSQSFWAHLKKEDVVLDCDVEQIKKGGMASDQEQISALIKHLLTLTDRKYNGFIKALVQTGQQHIATLILGEDLPSQLDKTQKDLPADKGRKLMAKLPLLRQTIRITNNFWDILVKNHVLSNFEIDDFKEMDNTDAQVNGLVEYLMMGTNASYRGFLYTLSETGQRHVVTGVLNEAVPDLSPTAQQQQDQSHSVLLPRDKKKLLKEKAPELITRITLSSLLWSLLSKYGAIPETDALDIETGNGSDASKVAKVLEVLKKGTLGHYHNFIRSLVESNQMNVVTDILGEDLSAYKVNSAGPVIVSPKLNDAITNLKQEYTWRMFSSTLHDDVKMEKVYTPVNLVERMSDGKSQKISESEVLQQRSNGKVLTLCTGDAGAGKSILARRMAWQWAKHKFSSIFWNRIKAVLLIQPMDEEDTLEQTMKNAVPGKQSYKDMIWHLYKEEPENVLIIVEAFDQFQNPALIKKIKQMVKDQAVNVFMTVRRNHQHLITGLQFLFNQRIEINGFSHENRIEFVKKCLKEKKSVAEMKEFLDAIEGKPLFERNPLNITLACQLFSTGQLGNTQIKTLTEVELYSMRESRMVEREIEQKEELDVGELSQKKDIELQKIHSLALYLMEKNKTTCKKADLDYLSINLKSPSLVLLEEHRTMNVKHGKETFWVWPHARLQEFDAASALAAVESFSTSLWSSWLASRPDLNSVAQLLAAKLGIDGRYDDVATLTTATLALQCKSECSEGETSRDNPSHPCNWIVKVRKMLSRTVDPGKAIDGDGCTPTAAPLNSPDLRGMCACKGSLVNGNISLWRHVQKCWKFGRLDVECPEYISKLKSTLLPAIDRSETDTLHLMFSETSHWKEPLKASRNSMAPVVEIHMGLNTAQSQDKNTNHAEWIVCVSEVLKTIKPQVLRLHHARIMNRPSEEVISLLNENQYLIDTGDDDTWIIWSSDENVKTTQEYIRGTNRFVFISRTRDDEVTFNVETLQDALCVESTDEYLKANEIVFNVGFPTAHSEYSSPSEETTVLWQKVLNTLQDLWQPKHRMLVRSFNSAVLDGIGDEKFKRLMRNDKGVDIVYESKDGITLYNMIETNQDSAGKEIYVYNTFGEKTHIRVQQLSDIASIKAEDIDIDIKDTLIFFQSDSENSSSVSDMATAYFRCIDHILAEFRVQHIIIRNHYKCVDVSVDGRAVLNAVHESCISSTKYHAKLGERQLQISRLHVQTLVSRDASQQVQIQHHGTGEVKLTVGELSDCLMLQTSDIKTDLKMLNVEIERIPSGSRKTSDGGEDSTTEAGRAAEDIMDVLHHLLETFLPPTLDVKFPTSVSATYKDSHHIFLEDGSLYLCRWNSIHTILSLSRHENHQTLAIPGTSRRVYIYQVYKIMKIVTDCLSDLMVLQKEHIDQPQDLAFSVYINRSFIQDAPTPPPSDLKQVFQHLLYTFHPRMLDIFCLNIETNIMHSMCSTLLEDGTVYSCYFSALATWVNFTREPNVQTVAVPGTARCVSIYPIGKETKVVLQNLEDLLAIKGEHLQKVGDFGLIVTVNCLLKSDPATSTAHCPNGKWQKILYQLLRKCHPQCIHLMLQGVGTDSVIDDNPCHLLLDDGTVYFCSWRATASWFIIERKDNVQTIAVPGTSRCVKIYQDGKKTNIVSNCLSDSMALQLEHINQPQEQVLSVYINHPFTKDAPTPPPPNLKHVFHHLLETFNPRQLAISGLNIETDIMHSLVFTLLRDGTVYSCSFTHWGAFVEFTREANVQALPVPGTSRCVSICPQHKGLKIVADRLEDCMVLQKEHFQPGEEKGLIVDVNCLLESNFSATKTMQNSMNEWQKVFHYLLETCRPPFLHIMLQGMAVTYGMKDAPSHILLNDGTLYSCHWRIKGVWFSIDRQDNVETVAVPGTSRNVMIYQEGKKTKIAATCLSDCMVLQRKHIQRPGEHILSLSLLNGEAPAPATVSVTEGWPLVIKHLLETFHPLLVNIQGLTAGTDIKESPFHIPLENTTVYFCYWNADATQFSIRRFDNMQTVNVPNTSRCVKIYKPQEKKPMVRIVATMLSDCMVLNTEHIQRLNNTLAVHPNLLTLDAVNGTAQRVIQHLLNTFHPPDLRIVQSKVESEIKEGFYMMSTDNTLYNGRWSAERDHLIVIDRNEAFGMLQVPDTSRYIGIMQVDDGTVSVVANRLSDCLALHTDHIKPSDSLTLYVDLSLVFSHPNPVAPDSKSEWQRTVQHLKTTFHPAVLSIQVPGFYVTRMITSPHFSL